MEAERGDLVRTSGSPDVEKVRQLLDLRGIGINSAWLVDLWRYLQDGVIPEGAELKA